MRTAAYKVDVASDRRRRENVPRHILCSIYRKKYNKPLLKIIKEDSEMYQKVSTNLNFVD